MNEWVNDCGEIEKVPKTCHFNLPTRRSYLYVNSEDYNNKVLLWQCCCHDWVVTELFIAEMLLMVWDHFQSSHCVIPLLLLLTVKWKNMPFSSFIVVGRFASSTNCLFMHSAERRFCCHTNFEVVVGKALKGRRRNCHDKCCPLKSHQFTSKKEGKGRKYYPCCLRQQLK